MQSLRRVVAGGVAVWRGWVEATPVLLQQRHHYTPAAPDLRHSGHPPHRLAGVKCGKVEGGEGLWKRGLTSGGGSGGGKSPPSSVTITSVALDNKEARVEVEWSGGEVDVYPYVWLRDNCCCPACFHTGSSSRILIVQDLNPDTRPDALKVVDGGVGMEVRWEDGHSATYQASWLHERAFNSTRRRVRTQLIRLEQQYWDTGMKEQLPRADFSDLLRSDAALLTWLQDLEVFGFVEISGAPAEEGQVRRLAERVAFVKKTHYGEDFSVRAKPDPSNVAYLSGPLQLHADLPYYEYKPGVQLIHCIQQYTGEGAESQVTDAVRVARDLKLLHPHHYHALTTTPVDWWDLGSDETGEFDKVLRLPMICTDANGEVVRVNVSQPQRDSHFSVEVEEVAPWYHAMLAFHALLRHPKYCLQFKMAPGTVLSLDNLRMVHGRSGYGSSQQGSAADEVVRHVEGCYLDWDEVRSRRRVLHRHLTPVTV